LAVLSGSLNFPIPDILTKGDRSVLVFTTENADPERIQAIRKQTGQVVFAGKQSIYGQQLVDRFTELGYKTIYSATGPKVLHLLLAGGVLDRLYLTQVNRILGGGPFSSIVEGSLLEPAIDFRLAEIYYDPSALDGLGQILKVFDRT
jgi:riboflavin biosynthesis pyrimidine reductase